MVAQAELLAYDQLRQYEESEERFQLYKLLGARG